MPTWLDATLKVLTPSATVVIAVYVARISRGQWAISTDKLRLDLFNRRFDIYLRVLDYYLSLSKSQNSSEPLEEVVPFIKAVRESRFMFPKNSGVYQHLEDFRIRANEVVNFTDSLKMLAEMPEERAKLTERHGANTIWLDRAMMCLEDKMEPYLQFNKL